MVSDTDLNDIIASIYDCAAAPELWPQTLEKIRRLQNAAYVSILFTDFSLMPAQPQPVYKLHATAWDFSWFAKLQDYLSLIPHVDRFLRDGIDAPWTQMDQLPETEFQKTQFYQEWAKPQGLRDVINTMYFDRHQIRGNFSMAGGASRGLFDGQDKHIAGVLSPHVRRALAINDLVDKGNLALALHRSIIDKLTTAVFVVGRDGLLIFSNAAGEAMLVDGSFVKLASRRITAASGPTSKKRLDDAIARAVVSDGELGIRGIGVPIKSASGERCAAYVLPLAAKGARSDLIAGHAAIFIARRQEQQPMATEILRTLFELTPTEARIAVVAAQGDDPAAIAAELSVSVETVRFHLKNIYAKIGARGKAHLVAVITAAIPPLTEQ